MQVVLVKGEDLCAGDSKQKRGMAGDEKLRALSLIHIEMCIRDSY